MLKCIQPRDADIEECHTSVTVTAADNMIVKAPSDPNFASHWLEQAQKHMTNTAFAEKMLLGKLYNAMIRKVDASTEGLEDPDARALLGGTA